MGPLSGYLWLLGNRLYLKLGWRPRDMYFLGNLTDPLSLAARLKKLIPRPVDVRRAAVALARALAAALYVARRCRDSPLGKSAHGRPRRRYWTPPPRWRGYGQRPIKHLGKNSRGWEKRRRCRPTPHTAIQRRRRLRQLAVHNRRTRPPLVRGSATRASRDLTETCTYGFDTS